MYIEDKPVIKFDEEQSVARPLEHTLKDVVKYLESRKPGENEGITKYIAFQDGERFSIDELNNFIHFLVCIEYDGKADVCTTTSKV